MDRSLEPVDKKVVIAVVNGELTVKRLRKMNGRIVLMPENKDYHEIELIDGMDCEIWGVVAHVVHTL